MRARVAIAAALLAVSVPASAAATEVSVVSDERGHKLHVDGSDFMVFGMNWTYVPVGENFAYSLWNQPDALIERVLHRDMGLLQDMGVNTIRQTPGIPPRWVAWIYEHYQIYTAINPFLGRYGATINGVWIANVDYGDSTTRKALVGEVVDVVQQYRDTPGVLMWILGNENNYGLHWTSFEVEALPGGEDAHRAAALYTLYGEAIAAIKQLDARPVAIANGDLQYLDLIARYCKDLDILGTNVYRGKSARDLYDRVRDELGIPVMFTEFGSDAFDARRGKEDAVSQAVYLKAQWEELYANSYGKAGAGTAIGGMIFQWADGWWKHGQTDDLDIHDTTASWPNDAYDFDYVAGEHNMNEEWFGICAKDPPDEDGFYELYPRPAYYLLRAAFRLDPYAEETTPERITEHFGALEPMDFAVSYDAGRARADLEEMRTFRISDVRARLETIGTKGDALTERGSNLVIDHTESIYVDVEFRPSSKARAAVSLNFVGNVAQNRLDPLSFENRVRTAEDEDPTMPEMPVDEDAEVDLERFAIYGAELEAEYSHVRLEGFYRTGHGHWGYEGDFFGLYREAYYGPAIDTYQANAPFGAVLEGKRELSGFKVAFGPEVYWGANPSIIGKYSRRLGPLDVTVVHQEDIAASRSTAASSVVPEPATRRSTLYGGFDLGGIRFEAGGIFAASQRVGDRFVYTQPAAGAGYLDSGYDVFEDQIRWQDTFGGKLKITRDGGRLRWYAQGGVQGLVADGGGDSTITLTKWSLKPSGRGNQVYGTAGMAVGFGSLAIAPHALYQRPLVGPNPAISDRVDPMTGIYSPGVSPRNVLDDPFAVLENRETIGGELLLVWDPTPATWFWAWDNDVREDAALAGSLDVTYRRRPTIRDANTAIIASGDRIAFGAAPPPSDAWDARLRLLGHPLRKLRWVGEVFAGRDEARGDDDRIITRYGASARVWWHQLALWTELRLSDWGPYDYYRDFNLTYPLQWYSDVSYGVGANGLHLGDVRLGLRSQLRTLDQYSPELLDLMMPHTGLEYEVMSYLAVNL